MKKACNVVCHRSLFLCLSGISHGGIVGKFLPKAVDSEKVLKRWDGHMRAGGGGGVKPSAHYLSFTIVTK